MKFQVSCFLLVLYFTVCVNGLSPAPENRGLTQLRSLATHLFASHSNGTSPTDVANNMIQNISDFKYTLVTSLVNFLAPVIQSILIFAVILFALAGTGTIVCSLFDCQGGLGLNNLMPSYGSHHMASNNSPYYQHSLMNADPSNLMKVIFKRKEEFLRKPWANMQNSAGSSNLDAQVD